MDFDQVSIETPEHVNIAYELAGPGSRLVAAVLDHLIIALTVAAVVLLVTAAQEGLPGSGAPLFVLMLIVGGPIILICLYFTLFEVLWSGQTPGKRATGLRVMRDDGTPIGALDSFIRNVVRVVDFLPYFYFLGAVVAFAHKESKRLGDLAAGTVVVKLRETVLPTTIEPPAQPAMPADDLAVLIRPAAAALTSEELAALQRFGERRWELAPDVRSEMAGRLIGAVRSKLPPEAVAAAETEPEAVIEALARIGSAARRDRF